MPVTDLADPLEVAGRRREAATRVLHRLQEDGGDGVRTFELDRFLDTIGGPSSKCFEVVAVLWSAVEVGVWHPEATGRERFEHLLGGRYAGECEVLPVGSRDTQQRG